MAYSCKKFLIDKKKLKKKNFIYGFSYILLGYLLMSVN